VVIASFGIELHYLKLKSVPFITKLILLSLFNFTIIALFTLMFFVAKTIVKLYVERKYKVLGYKFKTKLVVILVVLTLIPTTFLFLVAGGLITNYIDRWFAPLIKQPLESSISIAKSYYEIERQKTIDYAQAISKGQSIIGEYRVERLSKIPEDATETVRAAFEGKEGTEVISGDRGDIVRAVLPEFKGRSLTGVIIVESFVPLQVAKNVDDIQEAYKNYLTLESWKFPIKSNYLLILGFMTTIVIFLALWVALKISRGITDPIQNLAQATEQIASGNLNVKVPIEQEDEIGLLTKSFNHMIKELKENKESLHSAYLESDRRRLFMENILDNINSGVVMLDVTGTILMVNKRACSILSTEPEQVIRKHYRELMSLIDSEELQALVKSIEGKEFKPVKKEIKAKIGDRNVILFIFITSLKDSQKYIGLLVVFDDITDIIEAQKVLTWQDIAKKIAHEVKNPLTPIKLSTERIIKKWEKKDADFDEVFRRSTNMIVKEVESLKRLVDEFSKFGTLPEIQKTPTSLSTIIDEVINLYKDYKNIEIHATYPENAPLLELDGEQMRRVLINIFDNAVQAMNNSGKIDVTLHFDALSNIAHIEIADNGPGITSTYKERLFEPYFSTKKDGTGLGLPIASRVIKEHGGSISVRDNKPNGTIFILEIPMEET
jgi:two-component system nitrogen regulation sensor histidine kinase NtrY